MIKNRLHIIIFSVLLNSLYAPVTKADNNTEALIDSAIQGTHRSAENKARDVYRHPRETLLFFGDKTVNDGIGNPAGSGLVYRDTGADS